MYRYIWVCLSHPLRSDAQGVMDNYQYWKEVQAVQVRQSNDRSSGSDR